MERYFERVSFGDIPIDEREIWARLGGMGALDDEKISGVISEISSVATPAFAARELFVRVNNAKCVCTDELTVASEDFARIVNGCRRVLVLGGTLGMGVDRLIYKKSAISVAEGFIYDAVASAVVEGLMDLGEIRLTSGYEHTRRFSPGYGDMPMAIQGEIINLIDGGKTLGIALAGSKLMSPSKSVTALIGLK